MALLRMAVLLLLTLLLVRILRVNALQVVTTSDDSQPGKDQDLPTATDLPATGVFGHDGHHHRRPAVTEEDKQRLKQHEEFAKEHAGHEEMHTEIVLVLLGVLTGTQILMLLWKRNHQKSFNRFTLLGLWIVPVIISCRSEFWRFLFLWIVFSCLNIFVMLNAYKQPLAVGTPRTVYKWFYVVYHVCYTMDCIGYVMLLTDVLGVWRFLQLGTWMFETAIVVIFYGLYFGVLGRDFADVCSDRMASTLGFYSKDGIPSRQYNPSICAICCHNLYHQEQEHQQVQPTIPVPDSPSRTERTIKLECTHVFHEWCIRGWCIIGKKNICPYCKEKVDLRSFQTNPWDSVSVMHAGLLDILRYLLVWNPLMLIAFKAIVHILDLK